MLSVVPAIHIRHVPERTLAALRERADRHGRSVQKEILLILEEAATAPAPGEAPPPLRLRTVPAGSTSTWRREDIYEDTDGR